MRILPPIIANRNIMCPFDFYGLEDDSFISARYDGRTLNIMIRVCPWCDRKYTTLKYFDDLKTIHIRGKSYINLNLPEYRMRTMVELNERGKPVEKREKTIEEKIIDILSERQPLYPKHIARYIKEDSDTVKDYLYSKRGDLVYRDSEFYWWINDCSLEWTHDRIYYYTEYVKSAFWRFRDESEIEDSRLILSVKDGDEKAINSVADKLLDGIDELIENQVKTDYLIFAPLPSSKVNKKSAMFEVASRIKENCSFQGYIYVLNLLSRYYDMPAAHEKRVRPTYEEQKDSIMCIYPSLCSDNYTCILLDDITTKGTMMDICRDILIENGMPEENIIRVAFAKTGR